MGKNKDIISVEYDNANVNNVPKITINGNPLAVESYAHTYMTATDTSKAIDLIHVTGYFTGDLTRHRFSYTNNYGDKIIDALVETNSEGIKL
jgi:hypothetical protein